MAEVDAYHQAARERGVTYGGRDGGDGRDAAPEAAPAPAAPAAAAVANSWDDTPIGAAVKPSFRQQACPIFIPAPILPRLSTGSPPETSEKRLGGGILQPSSGPRSSPASAQLCQGRTDGGAGGGPRRKARRVHALLLP